MKQKSALKQMLGNTCWSRLQAPLFEPVIKDSSKNDIPPHFKVAVKLQPPDRTSMISTLSTSYPNNRVECLLIRANSLNQVLRFFDTVKKAFLPL